MGGGRLGSGGEGSRAVGSGGVRPEPDGRRLGLGPRGGLWVGEEERGTRPLTAAVSVLTAACAARPPSSFAWVVTLLASGAMTPR